MEVLPIDGASCSTTTHSAPASADASRTEGISCNPKPTGRNSKLPSFLAFCFFFLTKQLIHLLRLIALEHKILQMYNRRSARVFSDISGRILPR